MIKLNGAREPSKMRTLQKELNEQYANLTNEEEEDESITNLFSKWAKQKLKTGKRKMAEVE